VSSASEVEAGLKRRSLFDENTKDLEQIQSEHYNGINTFPADRLIEEPVASMLRSRDAELRA
ncbi:MAG TPA: hypothetical protein VM260_17335, partial [Pirellula sp.]|nr:hypothetical protein [Pirellula sp.]